jgi:cytochrome c553
MESEESVPRNSHRAPSVGKPARGITTGFALLIFPITIFALPIFAFAILGQVAVNGFLLAAGDVASARVPSLVAWTPETIATASSGDAFRGMLRARECEHCHGAEGFSPMASTPNLVGMDKLALWKQLEDFRSRKRISRVMNPVAESLSAQDSADLAAYYSAMPVFSDLQDNRSFPQSVPDSKHASLASHLISFGDGDRGIPPCQACHGPVAYRPGAPSLMSQNSDYVLNQLEGFAKGSRSNDINMPMRTIAGLLSEDERQALAAFYGAGLGLQSGNSK